MNLKLTTSLVGLALSAYSYAATASQANIATTLDISSLTTSQYSNGAYYFSSSAHVRFNDGNYIHGITVLDSTHSSSAASSANTTLAIGSAEILSGVLRTSLAYSEINFGGLTNVYVGGGARFSLPVVIAANSKFQISLPYSFSGENNELSYNGATGAIIARLDTNNWDENPFSLPTYSSPDWVISRNDFRDFGGYKSGTLNLSFQNNSTMDRTMYMTVGVISMAAVPEPETYAMLLAGLGLVGFAARRKRKAV